MYSPTTRVLTVLELLQAHGALSGPELARRLEVDGRTLRRYIARLEDLGIPVVAERGRYGAYRLMPGFKLPPMMFTDDEALALSMGLLAVRGLGLADAAPAVQSAQAKLERVMPEPLRRRVRALGETVRLDLSQPEPAADNAVLLALSAAAHEHQRVRLAYRSAQGEASQREVDPYGLAWRAGRWYMAGWCHLRGGLRSFRLDRVQQVEPLQAHFSAPADFDAVRHVALGIASLPRAIGIQVLLKTDLPTAREELFDAIGLFQPCEGGVLLHSQADDLDWYARQLARLSFEVEVRQPDELHAALRRCAQRLLQWAEAGQPQPQRAW
ncbi:helix-turn-helix transcriptional regulator [Variovorax terrae]|uniref:YafY family transcriptional regulator n=1 Tax=Variovorax terrae TaxID=2923278 RepID=A0A9X2AMX6_9BURK|nr:YafY family protein [Variovorax terrae]MCJ0761782.1 YafY family transcriptional regulator [Variovorax terrae]